MSRHVKICQVLLSVAILVLAIVTRLMVEAVLHSTLIISTAMVKDTNNDVESNGGFGNISVPSGDEVPGHRRRRHRRTTQAQTGGIAMARHRFRPNAREYAGEGLCFRFEFTLHGPPGGEECNCQCWLHDKVCWDTRDAKIYFHALQYSIPFHTCCIVEVPIISG